jgi:hypothetical protein
MSLLRDINIEELKKGVVKKTIEKSEEEIRRSEKRKELKKEIYEFLKKHYTKDFSIRKFNSIVKSKIEQDEDLKDLNITYISAAAIKKIEAERSADNQQ